MIAGVLVAATPLHSKLLLPSAKDTFALQPRAREVLVGIHFRIHPWD